ncbi:DUF6776 family protein [Thalassotalea fusca]
MRFAEVPNACGDLEALSYALSLNIIIGCGDYTFQMSWLAKINLKSVVQQFGAYRTSMLLFIVMALCFYVGYRVGNFYHAYQTDMIGKQERRLEKLYQEHADNIRRVHTLEVELEVERLANQQIQTALKDIEVDYFQAKKELGFYEKVMAPEKQADGLVVDSFTISPTESANHFRFQVVLVQQKVKKRFAKGYIELELVGSLAEKPSKLSLEKVSSLTKKDLSFSFQYFQIIKGEFTLPENFTPELVSLAAVLPKGKWQKFHRIDQDYEWARAINELNATAKLSPVMSPILD